MIPLALLAFGCAHHDGPPAASARPPAFSAVYSLRAAEATSTPVGIDAAMRDFYDVRMLIGVTRGSGDSLRLVLAPATADGLSQDRCYETTEWAAVSGPEGTLSVVDRALVFGADGTQGRLSAVSMQAALTPDGLHLDRLTGVLDTRPLVSRMGDSLAPDAFCSFLPAFGPCVACPDGSGATCWNLTLEGAVAKPVQATLEPRDHAAICADPACAGLCSGG